MNEIAFAGCVSTTLAGYLKGLGVFRLVAEQFDDMVRARWKAGQLLLLSHFTSDDIERFFLDSYKPTPILSPWSGRAGFLEGEAGDESTRKGATTLRALTGSTGARFDDYRKLVAAVKEVPVVTAMDEVRVAIKKLEAGRKIGRLSEDEQKKLAAAKRELKRLKDSFLASLRAGLDDTFLRWIDACYVIADDVAIPAPLLGSGGNEGSMDFSINHVAYLLDLIDSNSDASASGTAVMLNHALFGHTHCLPAVSNVGFLSVASSGGANMSSGYSGESTENPWSSVLILEGAVLLAASATKRLESGDKAGLSYPFMVQATLAGDGSVAVSEKSRPELWLPIWDAPASISEVQAFISEGRVTLGSHQARNGLDMLEALAELGFSRGITGFERIGFFERRGLGYYVAGHLGSYRTPRQARDAFLTRGLKQGGWLDRFSRFASGGVVANRFLMLRRQLEDRVFELSSRDPSSAEVQSLLGLLRDIRSACAASTKAREAVPAFPRLSDRWVLAADDGTPEFRIARALAEFVRTESEHIDSGDPEYRVDRVLAELGSLSNATDRLRVPRSLREKPPVTAAGARLDDVAAFLQDERMDARVAALLPGLCLCDIPTDADRTAGATALPAAFGLMKLALTPDRTLRELGHLGASDHVPIPVGMLAQLRAGNHGNAAVLAAWRRLRASGLRVSLGSDVPQLPGVDPARAAVALLVPLHWSATAVLARMLLEEPEVASVDTDAE